MGIAVVTMASLLQPNDTSDLYMMCFYFVCTVFTTVGFGPLPFISAVVYSGLSLSSLV